MSNDEGTPVGPNDKSVENAAENKKTAEATAAATAEQVKFQKQLADLLNKQVDESQKYYETLQRTAETLNDMTAARENETKLIEAQMREKVAGDEARMMALEAYLKAAKAGEETSIGNMEMLSDFSDELLQKNAKILKQNQQAVDGQRKYGSDQKKIIADMAGAIGLNDKYADTTLSKIYKGLEVVAKGGEEAEEYMKAMMDNIKETFNVKNLALNVFNAIKENSIEVFKSFDKAQAALAATTGQGQEFNDTLYEVGRQGNLFGVSMEKAGAAIGVLVNETSNFTTLSKSLQANIGLSVAKMEQLGVSTADSAKIFQNFNQGLGITASESIEMQKELAMAGVSIGISASKITKDFNASLSTLMVYGRESIDVFKGIAAAAKAAGVETSTLLGIASKFDTFAGAAEGAGKLNALLGTQLSTTELLMATEDERIRMLVESVQSQGVAFQDMDRFTQKAIANAAGISDMSEANRIFGMSLSAYDENQRKLQASADVQKKFDDAVAKTIPVMEKFKLLGAEIVVALEPFLDILGSVAETLTTFFKEMDTGTKEGLATFLTVLSGIVMITPVIKGFLGVLKFFGPTVAAADKVTKKSGKGFARFGKFVGKGLANAGKGLVSFGAGLVATMAPIVAFVAVAALLAAAIAGIGYAFSAVIDSGAKFYDMMFGVSDGEAKVKEFEARAAEAMATIVSSNHEGALSSIKAMVSEVNKMGQDVKISSTIENLALVTAGKATNITGQRVAASTTNVTANVQNFFEGLQMKLMIDDTTALNAHIASVSNGDKA